MSESPPPFILASPDLADPNFARSVVLLLQHNEDGAMGLVINHPTELTLGTFARSKEIACHPELHSLTVYRGGPVQTEVGFMLHTNDQLKERKEIIPGLFLSGSEESLKILLEAGNTSMRLVMGYSGWGPKQLEDEMSQGSWISADATLKHLFETQSSQMWDTVLLDMGVHPDKLAPGGGIH